MTGVEVIAVERARQQEIWTPEHDDEHEGCELAAAAVSYALKALPDHEFTDEAAWETWPWDGESFQSGASPYVFEDRMRCLAKAGALIAAEIERQQRRAATY